MNTNDGSQNAPALRFYMSEPAMRTMPQFAAYTDEQLLELMRQSGFHGVQFSHGTTEMHACARSLGLGVAESGRLNNPEEVDVFAAKFVDLGCECATTHLGWGLEDYDEAKRLINAVLDASAKHNLPIYPETHRSTIFQDIWRTQQFLTQFPDLYLNADYSHWYTGGEMPNGGVDRKLDFLEPAFARARFMHGRIGDPGCIQVPVLSREDDRSFVHHFREMWTRTFRAFLRTAGPGDYFCFSPELLRPAIFYARTAINAQGEEVEVSDRWQQSLLLNDIAQDCWDAAQRGL